MEIFFRRDTGIVYFSRLLIIIASIAISCYGYILDIDWPENIYIEFLRIFCMNCLDIIGISCDEKFLRGIYANYSHDFRTNFYTNRQC